jgi:hypothetical protein
MCWGDHGGKGKDENEGRKCEGSYELRWSWERDEGGVRWDEVGWGGVRWGEVRWAEVRWIKVRWERNSSHFPPSSQSSHFISWSISMCFFSWVAEGPALLGYDTQIFHRCISSPSTRSQTFLNSKPSSLAPRLSVLQRPGTGQR